ncbi:MAG: hypothetical protein QM775_30010 [Pirellulales bacterium]
MKAYSVQIDSDPFGQTLESPLVVLQTDSLDTAIVAADAARNRKAYVLHEASRLRGRLFFGVCQWVDEEGRESFAPESTERLFPTILGRW